MKNNNKALTPAHLQMAAALMEVLRDKLSISFTDQCAGFPNDEYVFGGISKEETAPHIHLAILGGGTGDYYSGSFDYQDVYRLEKATDANGFRLWVCYDHQSTNLAGDCSLFTAGNNLPQSTLDEIEDAFYKLLRNGVEVPVSFQKLLGS